MHPLLPAATMCAANWSETHLKLLQHGVDAHRATNRLRTLGVRIEPLTEPDAITAANLWAATRSAGLSLGDRCCLALAARLDRVAVTADTARAGLDIDIPVRIIR
ncbi:MAG: PIN domain-containing protein [Pseudonocardiales bacterium]